MTLHEITPPETPILDDTYLQNTSIKKESVSPKEHLKNKGAVPQEEISSNDTPLGFTREINPRSEVSGIFSQETGLTPEEFVEKKEQGEVEATVSAFLSKLNNEALHDFETEVVDNIRRINRNNKKKLSCENTLYILLIKEIIKRRNEGTLPEQIKPSSP